MVLMLIVASEIYLHALKVWTLEMTSGNTIAISLLVLDYSRSTIMNVVVLGCNSLLGLTLF